MEFEREELQKIRDRAWKESQIEGLNEFWVSACLRLAEAADYLDAMIARTEVTKRGDNE